MPVHSIESYLANIDPFRSLSESALRAMSLGCTLRTFESKTTIFREEDESSAAYVIVSGRVALFKTSPNGKELIIELLPAGELFGIVSFMGGGAYPLTARAQVETSVIVIPRTSVLPLLYSYPELQRGFAEVVTSRMRGSQNLARSIAHDRAEKRIASVLLALVPRAQQQAAQPRTPVISIGRQEIADLTGTTIETASRVIKALERESIVDATELGRVQILDLIALQNVSELSSA